MGDSPTSAIGTPEQIREHLRALQAAGVDQVLLMHQAGRLDHDANCRSLELFATEVMPEFVEGEAEREAAKAERLAPAIEAALARKVHLPPPGRGAGRRGLRLLQPHPDGRGLRRRGHGRRHRRRPRDPPELSSRWARPTAQNRRQRAARNARTRSIRSAAASAS